MPLRLGKQSQCRIPQRQLLPQTLADTNLVWLAHWKQICRNRSGATALDASSWMIMVKRRNRAGKTQLLDPLAAEVWFYPKMYGCVDQAFFAGCPFFHYF